MNYRVSTQCFIAVLVVGYLGIPLPGNCETAVFTLDTFEWRTIGLNGEEHVLVPIVLEAGVQRVTDVRFSFEGYSYSGTGCCNQGPEVWCGGCPSQLWAWFSESGPVRTEVKQFPGESAARAASLAFVSWRCDPTWYPICQAFPLGDDPWTFLASGVATLYVYRGSSTFCGSDCSAYIDLSLVTVEVDYETSVPAEGDLWGSFKARYR